MGSQREESCIIRKFGQDATMKKTLLAKEKASEEGMGSDRAN